MKNTFSKIIAAITCITSIICIIAIISLNERLTVMEQNLRNAISNTQSSINSISSNVENTLLKENSIILDSSYKFDTPDVNKQVLMLNCSVTPKEYSKELSTAKLILNDTEYPMTFENGNFKCEAEIPLFSNIQAAKFSLTTNGITKVEILDWRFNTYMDRLPQVQAALDGTAEGGTSYIRKGTLYVNVFYTDAMPINLKSIYLIEMLDGNEIDRTLLQSDVSGNDNHYNISYNLDKTYNVPKGSTHELYADITDIYGTHYQVLVDSWSVDEAGVGTSGQADSWTSGPPKRVFDSNGNPITLPNTDNLLQ